VAEYRTLLGECKQAVLHESPIALRAVYQREYSRMTAIQTIHTILRSENRPMKVIELAEAAIKGGYGGSNAPMDKVVPNSSSTISRSLKDLQSIFVRGEERGMIELRECRYADGKENE
jgi:hypothetical protein